MDDLAVEQVGIVGLGTMGGSMARHLLAAEYRVVGHDVARAAATAFAAAGGAPAASAAEVAARADAVILSLPSAAAFDEVTSGADGLLAGARPGLIVIETSTLPLAVKEGARRLLAERGVALLDCPISGTGAQIRTKDIAIYASGDPAALDRARPGLAGSGPPSPVPASTSASSATGRNSSSSPTCWWRSTTPRQPRLCSWRSGPAWTCRPPSRRCAGERAPRACRRCGAR